MFGFTERQALFATFSGGVFDSEELHVLNRAMRHCTATLADQPHPGSDRQTDRHTHTQTHIAAAAAVVAVEDGAHARGVSFCAWFRAGADAPAAGEVHGLRVRKKKRPANSKKKLKMKTA